MVGKFFSGFSLDIVKAYGPGAFEFSDSFLTVRIPYNPIALDSPLSDGGGVSGGVSGGEVENDDFAAILSLVSESDGATTADIVSGTGIPKRSWRWLRRCTIWGFISPTCVT